MSQANAAAIKRRANPGTTSLSSQTVSKTAPVASASPSNVNNPGLTLPQVISLVDKRLIQLETFVLESKNSKEDTSGSLVENEDFEKVMESMANEINHRFEIFAGEIANLKEIVLKLQSYTMDVNRQLLSEIGTLGEKPEVELIKDTSTSIDLREMVKEEFAPSEENSVIFTNI